MDDQTNSSAGKPGHVVKSRKTLTYDRAEAFYGIRLQLPLDAVMRQAVYSMLAMWQAAHNTDYYITKYGTKALEQFNQAPDGRELRFESAARSLDDVLVALAAAAALHPSSK